MAEISARILNQNKYKYQTLFSARFYKRDEDDQVLDGSEFNISLNVNQNLTESNIGNINIISQLEHQIQNQEIRDSDWICDNIDSEIKSFCKSSKKKGSKYVKVLLRTSAKFNIESDDNYCFLWSILAGVHPCRKSHPTKASNYRQYLKN